MHAYLTSKKYVKGYYQVLETGEMIYISCETFSRIILNLNLNLQDFLSTKSFAFQDEHIRRPHRISNYFCVRPYTFTGLISIYDLKILICP